MSRKDREHPTLQELEEMPNKDLAVYALREARFLADQKQTAVPRLLREMAARLVFP